MFNKKKQPPIKSLIAQGTRVDGNVIFHDGLRVDGEVVGDIRASTDQPSILVISELASVKGEIVADHVIINGSVKGPVNALDLLELQPKTDRIQAALTYAKQNLKSELSVEELANAANLSPRQFSRVFNAETGQSPAKAIESLRVESARLMMETGRHSIDVVATETGFGDRERMRRAFLRAFGQPPQVIQRANRG